MANTVLKFRDQSVRVNYHDLEEVLSILNQRLEKASPARQVTEPWLNHIREDLGYVLLDTNVLEMADVISDFDRALAILSSDLQTGNVSQNTPRWKGVSGDVRARSAYLQRIQSVVRELRSVFYFT